MFTDETNKYAGQNVLFICDIRSADRTLGHTETATSGNVESQQRWHDILNPKKACLSLGFLMPPVDRIPRRHSQIAGLWAHHLQAA